MEQYRSLGIKLTPQRLEILKYLEGNTTHPSAEDIYVEVKKRFPSMSFATVYNTLDTLMQGGKVLQLTVDPQRKRYDPNTETHHHFICTSCGKIHDIHKKFQVSQIVDEGFDVTSCHVEFRGTCPTCRVSQ